MEIVKVDIDDSQSDSSGGGAYIASSDDDLDNRCDSNRAWVDALD